MLRRIDIVVGMPDSPEVTAAPTRRQRSDGRRSAAAILNGARVMLGRQPDASVEEIAAEAGVTRQTVYAHFTSRDALVAALVQSAAAEYLAMIDAIGLDTTPPADALVQFLDAGWQFLRRHPALLNPGATGYPRPQGNDPHDVVPPRLERLILRGQGTGDFDPSPPAAWLAAAVLGLLHTAAAEVAAKRLTPAEAETLCLGSTLRLCGIERRP
jgi:AcrR family transcriptional regulator